MKALKIIKCSDSMMWYRDMVGQIITLAKPEHADLDVYWSREPAGYINIVNKQDAEIIEVKDESSS
jgi:hypothetical protein